MSRRVCSPRMRISASFLFVACILFVGLVEPATADEKATGFINLQPQLQVNTQTIVGQQPAPTNSAPIFVRAQLLRFTSEKAPFESINLPLSAAGSSLIKVSGAPNFNAVCSLTNANTLFECTLTPSPGPLWNAAGPLFVRVTLTSTDGHSSTTLVAVNVVGGVGATLQVQTPTGSGPGPAAGNGTPLLVVAQLVRSVIGPLPPGDSLFLPLAPLTGSEVTKVAGSPATAPNFVPACSLTNGNTLLECTLNPTGATWGTSGVIFVRLRLTAAAPDSSNQTGLFQFRIN